MPKQAPAIDGKGATSIARNATYLLGGQGVTFVARFIYAIILARVLGPKVYGMINYGTSWYLLFLPLTRMGLEVVLSRDVGRNRQEGERTAAATLTLRIAYIALATAAYCVSSWFLEEDPATRALVFLFSLALIGRSLVVWTENMYVAYEVNHHSFRQQSLFRPLEVVLGSLVVLVWRDALLAVLVHGIVWCLSAAYGLSVIRRQGLPLRLETNRAELRRVFNQGLPLGASLLLTTLLYQGPLIFFRHLAPAGNSLGQLALALQVFFMLSQFPAAFGSVSLPVLSRSAARQDGKDRVFAETMLRFSLLLGTMLALLGMALGPWLTVQLFGDRYAQAGALVGPVLWLTIPWTSVHVLLRVMMARRLDMQALYCTLSGAALFALTISAAVARYGSLGAIWSTGAGMGLAMLVLLYFLHGTLKMDLRASLTRPGLIALSGIGVYFALRAVGPVWSLLAAYGVLALGCYRFSCLTQQDLAWFGQSFKWISKKLSFTKG